MINSVGLLRSTIAPLKEITAYEALWEKPGASFKSLASLFSHRPGSKPSDFVSLEKIEALRGTIKRLLLFNPLKYGVHFLINGTFSYPGQLKDAKYPVEILYYAGDAGLLSAPCVSVIGCREPSDDGLRRTQKLVRVLVHDGLTVLSGLARGVDTIAHKTAIEAGGKTIAVIGTPVDHVYPRENGMLQQIIANQYLLVSQVPFYRYRQQSIKENRLFFPERNKTMSALTKATIIVEAQETSGALIQARAALYQGRRLFILGSCFRRAGATWPYKLLKQGAVRVESYEDISRSL